jgi:hypothetical protein
MHVFQLHHIIVQLYLTIRNELLHLSPVSIVQLVDLQGVGH